MPPKAPEIDDRHGFIRADCESCKNPDVWLTCNTCKKSDRFVAEEKEVVCHCGAKYAFATCTCGKPVPRARLVWMPFDKGPVALADWEVDWGQVVVLVVVALLLIGIGVAVWYASSM